MKKTNEKTKSRSVERSALVVFLIVFLTIILGSWIYAMNLRQTVVSNNAIISADPTALVEVEKIRNLAESQMASSRSFFLLGSKALYDKQKQEKQELAERLAGFQKKYSLSRVPEIIKSIEIVMQQHQEIFDQGMDFREKQTESKIVGQFYHSKAAPMLKQINDSLDEITRIHKTELDRSRMEIRNAAIGVEEQIPRGMLWLTSLLGLVFLGMSAIIILMLRERSRQLTERSRLYEEAKRAVHARDEFIAAVSHDFKDPLSTMTQVADYLPNFADSEPVRNCAEVIKTAVVEIENRIKDIGDEKTAEQNGLSLRLDQMSVDDILEDTRVLMQPLAKQRDIRLQVEPANPPVLAFVDRERVMRVLSNLVSNAIKFSPKHSKVVVKVRSDQQFVNVSVTDNGSGIPEKKLTEIFDHFWQAKKTADQGAGIGLAVVKTIVEAHGGVVKVDSRVGSGTTFTFSLPRRRPAGAQLKKVAPIRYTTRPRNLGEVYSDGPS